MTKIESKQNKPDLSEKYFWFNFSDEEFRKWYMGENKIDWERSKGKIFCDTCNQRIKKYEDLRADGGRSYDPKCFKEKIEEELKNEHPNWIRKAFIERSLKL